MTFALRGLAISFSTFFLIYTALSVAVCLAWRAISRHAQSLSASRHADWLFTLRLLPFAIGTFVTLLFAVPSFLLLEPHSTDEPMSILPLLLGVCGVVVLSAGIWNAGAAMLRTSRAIARWSSGACVMNRNLTRNANSVPVLRTSLAAPPLTAAGIFRSTLWLSAAAEFVLTERELHGALRHECIHVRRRDNLRKLFLRFVTFPGMAELELTWREATEMAADEAAVSSASEALDLAAAVIKLSRVNPLQPPAELTTALVHSPAEYLQARVERLLSWKERPGMALRASRKPAICAAIVCAVVMSLSYSYLITNVHAATEWLVR